MYFFFGEIRERLCGYPNLSGAMAFYDNSRIIFSSLLQKKCGYSIEVPQQGASSEYLNMHIFLWRNVKNYPSIIIKSSVLTCHMSAYEKNPQHMKYTMGYRVFVILSVCLNVCLSIYRLTL